MYKNTESQKTREEILPTRLVRNPLRPMAKLLCSGGTDLKKHNKLTLLYVVQLLCLSGFCVEEWFLCVVYWFSKSTPKQKAMVQYPAR